MQDSHKISGSAGGHLILREGIMKEGRHDQGKFENSCIRVAMTNINFVWMTEEYEKTPLKVYFPSKGLNQNMRRLLWI